MPEISTLLTRRSLVGVGLQAGAAVAATAFEPAWAAGLSPKRAAVCIYLFGGNDSNNMVVPLDQYSSYARSRGPLALSRNSLLPVTDQASGDALGFHPEMKEVAALFGAGALAVVANVGRTDSTGGAVREQLDALATADPGLHYHHGGLVSPAWAASLDSRCELVSGFAGLRKVSAMTMVTPAQCWFRQRQTVRESTIQTVFPDTGIGRQLRNVAEVIAAGSMRHVFTVQLGGFHAVSRHLDNHAILLRQLSESMGAFYRATQELGVSSSVVTYTDTEFNRTLSPNKKGIIQRGWGGHQLVMGGGIEGETVYGQFPSLYPGSPTDVTGKGVWQPAIASSDYAAGIAAQLGIQNRHSNTVLRFRA